MQDIHPKTVSESLDTLIKNIIKPYMSKNNHEIIMYNLYMCHRKNQQRFCKNIYTRSVAFSLGNGFLPCLETPSQAILYVLFLGRDFLSLCENTISALDLVVASEVKLLVKVRGF